MPFEESQGQRGRRSGRTPGRRPLAEGNAENTRADIRRHAVGLFNERGYASVSIDDIARAASVNRATVYYHFQNKEAVLLDSLQIVTDFVQSEIKTITEQSHLSVRDRLLLLVRTRRRMEHQNVAGADEMDEHRMHEAMQHLSPQGQQRLGRTMAALHEMTQGLIEEGIKGQELLALPPQVIDYAFWQLFPPDGYPDELGLTREAIEESLLDLFFNGLQPK